ncbi:MAG: phosphatase PAP2 family protein [Clostridia bacterium]|nr:phosphatase PAP2 family protein [Clostridia bacterium]
MEILYFIANMRCPVLDFFFETITHLGEETFFLVISILFFWCINKREGYYILLSGLFGTLINQAAKITFRIDRPWIKDPSFQPVGNSKLEATGYSFPSGHTQNIATTWGCIAAYNRKRWLSIVCVVIIALVSFSRLYLGVHTLLDVSVSLLVALLLVVLLRPFFATEERFNKAYPVIVIISVIASVAYLIYVLSIDPAGVDGENYHSALKNACTLTGCTVGLVLVYFVDTKWTKFETAAPWYAQIIKVLVGFGIVLAIKAGLSSPLTALFGNEYVARTVRYFLIVAFAGALWPITFKYFAKMKIPALDRFGERVSALFTRR